MAQESVRKFKQTKLGLLPETWIVKKISEVFEIKAGGDLKKLDFSKVRNSEYKYPIYSNSLNNKGLYGFSNTYQYEGNCITVTARGDVGHAEFRDYPFCAIVRLLVLKPKINVSGYFISNFINSKLNFSYVGAAVNQLTIPQISNELIAYPLDIDEQRKISSVLSAYDDLIENNLRRIQILEEMAQLIYREWFVNFRFPGHEKVKFVDSELGRIPEGWEVTSLGDICTIEKNKYKEMEHSTLPLLDLARIPRKSLAINSLGSSCELKTSRIIFKKSSVLFGSIRPYFHKVFYAFCDGITNTSVFVIQAVEQVPVSFLFSLLFSEDSVNWANQNSSGTKMPVISWDVFKTMKIILPDKNLLNKFNTIVSSFLEEICLLNLKNLKLKATRDLLLHKLISGELDVSDLDIAVKGQKE